MSEEVEARVMEVLPNELLRVELETAGTLSLTPRRGAAEAFCGCCPETE